MASRTLVLRVSMDPETEDVVRAFGKESARWEQRVFGRWYADFRAHRENLSESVYAGLLSTKRISAQALGRKGGREKYRVNVQGRGHNLYNLFVTKGKRIEPAVPTRIRSSHLLGPLSHLGTTLENFLDRDLRRQRCHERRVRRRRREARARRQGSTPKSWSPSNFLPRFQPIARFQHDLVHWDVAGPLPVYFECRHPFAPRQQLRVDLVQSPDPRYAERLAGLTAILASGKKAGVELKYHDDGAIREGWYAHIAVPEPDPVPPASIDRVMGVDVGERNPATLVVLEGPAAALDRVGVPRLYSGLSTRHELECESNRVRRLRSAVDQGSKGAGAALEHARGRQARILITLAHQVSHDIVREALSRDVDAIAMEDLTRFVPGERIRHPRMRLVGRGAKRQRRLLSRWNRGQVQGFIRYKAGAHGLRLAGPRGQGIYARGTSSTCPKCAAPDPGARDRSRHLFHCRATGCGFRDNDDVVGASNIAARGWKYFHPADVHVSASAPPAGALPGVNANPPAEPGRVSTRVDPIGSSGLMGGVPSVPQATVGGTTGSTPRFPANGENGVGVASPQGIRLSPTPGGKRGISKPTTSRRDEGSIPPTGSAKAADCASGEGVIPSPDAARALNSREKQVRERRRKRVPGLIRHGALEK